MTSVESLYKLKDDYLGHHIIGNTYMNVSEYYMALNKNDEAIVYLKKALNILAPYYDVIAPEKLEKIRMTLTELS